MASAPGIGGPKLRLAIAEAAAKGRANRAVCATPAKALGLAASAVTLLQGASWRKELLQVAGDPWAFGPKALAPKPKELA